MYEDNDTLNNVITCAVRYFVVLVVLVAGVVVFILLLSFYSNPSYKFRLPDIDDCVNHTCANSGSCVDGLSNYSCDCMPGYTGVHCEAGRLFLVPFVTI